MKRVLLGSSALLGLGLLSGPATAAEPIKLGIGGYFLGYGVAGDEDGGAAANRRNHKIARESEIHFKGKTTLDNGLTFGVRVELEAEVCADQIDETFMYVEGGFGRIIVGEEDPAPYLMYMGAPKSALPGHGFTVPTFQHAAAGGNAHGAIPTNLINISGDSEKLLYMSPRFAGLQLGVNYTPENCEEVRGTCGGSYGGFPSKQNAGQQSEVVEIGANYTRKIGVVDLALFGGYGEGNVEAPAAGQTDQTQWSVGARVAVAGLQVGASYNEDDLGTSGSNTDQEETLVGISYATGPWSASLLYWHSAIGAGAALGKDTVDAVELGASYDLGPGISLSGGVQYFDFEDNLNVAANENEALLFILGTSISF
jgi:predicted porin